MKTSLTGATIPAISASARGKPWSSMVGLVNLANILEPGGFGGGGGGSDDGEHPSNVCLL